jgi:hypothetical protein
VGRPSNSSSFQKSKLVVKGGVDLGRSEGGEGEGVGLGFGLGLGSVEKNLEGGDRREAGSMEGSSNSPSSSSASKPSK